MSASLELGHPTSSSLSLFLKSQFLTSPLLPPTTTNFTGQTAIITGSTSGLGLEASRQLLSFGLSTLIITSRSPQKGEEVGSRLRAQFPAATIKFWPLSLDSYPSIQAFAALANKLERLDIAILNAGMQIADFVLIPETAHETLVQVNYLSTFLLGILLLPILKAKSPAGTPGRLSIVSSGSARGATLSIPNDKTVLGTLDDQTLPWKPVERYAVSKLLGHLFTINLASYISPEDVVVNLVDPGLVKGTDLQGLAPWPAAAFFWAFKALLGRTVSVGGSTYLDAVVVKGKESHGSLVANWRISSFAAFVYTPEGEAIREQLWKETMAEFEFAGVQEILDSMKK